MTSQTEDLFMRLWSSMFRTLPRSLNPRNPGTMLSWRLYTSPKRVPPNTPEHLLWLVNSATEWYGWFDSLGNEAPP